MDLSLNTSTIVSKHTTRVFQIRNERVSFRDIRIKTFHIIWPINVVKIEENAIKAIYVKSKKALRSSVITEINYNVRHSYHQKKQKQVWYAK